jgi:ferredoxin--NADP+ reductase
MTYKIVHKKELAPTIKMFEVEAPVVARKAKAGQFVILRISEHGERIPLTIADVRRETITLVVEEVGKTTKELGRLNEGDSIVNLVGPLGNPMKVEKYGHVICIGGGSGVALVYPLTKALKEAGNKVASIIGAKTQGLLILEEEMRETSDEFYVTTDDGSKGHRGFVTDILRKLLDERERIDLVVAVGPVPMMKAVADATSPHEVKTLVSLNPIMVDGMGMCGACRVTVGGKTKFTCVDGPLFDGHLVDFGELEARRRVYEPEEKRALKAYEEKLVSPHDS